MIAKTVSRRLEQRLVKLEGRLGVVETAFTKQLGARIEAGRRRAGRMVRSPEEHSGMTVEQILQRDRLRASEQTLAESTQGN